jgi:hypothetical protein
MPVPLQKFGDNMYYHTFNFGRSKPSHWEKKFMRPIRISTKAMASPFSRLMIFTFFFLSGSTIQYPVSFGNV